jgi:hypothetical protein
MLSIISKNKINCLMQNLYNARNMVIVIITGDKLIERKRQIAPASVEQLWSLVPVASPNLPNLYIIAYFY